MHFLQGLLSGNDLINPRLPGEFKEAREDGTIAIEVDGHELFFWNHEPERIDEAVFFGGSKIAYQPKWGLLYVPSSQGNYAFFVAESLEDHLPCPTEPPVGTPMELLKSAGGFYLPIGDIWKLFL